MATLTADFEGGTVGNNIATGDAGSLSAWQQVSRGTNATLAYDNTHSYVSKSAKIATAATTTSAFLRWTIGSAVTDEYGRFYLYMTANPSVLSVFVLSRNGNNTASVCSLRVDTNGKIALYDSSAIQKAISTNAIALNQWVRIEWHFVHSTGGSGKLEARLFNSPDSATPTETVTSATNLTTTGTNGDTLDIGQFTNVANFGPIWLDQIVGFQATAYPDPFPVFSACTVSGSTPVGSTLTVSPTLNGTYTLAYQWTRDGSNIAAATSSTYVTVSGDAGHAVGCTVTATGQQATNETASQASSNTIAVGGVANTLTIDPGAVAVTGTTATTPTARRLTVLAGAEAVTGASTSLPLARRFTGTAGSIAITGATALLPLARRMSGTAGAFTITGNQILAPLARTLIGSPGSYLLTGDSILTPLQRFLTASPGSVTLTGSTAALVLGRVLSATPGTFVITGDDATLVFTGALVQYTLDLASGTVTVTGDTAAATVHRILTATAASYAITGDDLAFALLRAYVLNLTAGAVAVTGQPASLQLARVLAALAGDTTISGADLDFIIGGALFIAAQAGAMATTGFPADLVVRGIIQGLCPPKPGHLAEPEFGTLPAATPVELDTGRVCV